MARATRRDVFSPDEIAILHVMNRTTRRCFLFGDDPLTGRNYDHRKVWFEERLQFLASQFGIDLLCYAVLSNHFHLILRSRPDVVRSWDDTQVASRWLTLCPPRLECDGTPATPTELDLDVIRNNPEKLEEIRRRLSDVSWWMRLLSQKIAQRANHEEQETGKFFQARFKATRLLDEMSLLACAAYVDLNPIRAALAETLEGSSFTSIQRRMIDLKASVSNFGSQEPDLSAESTHPPQESSGFLAPVELQERDSPVGSHGERRRCSNRGFLNITAAAYAELLDWTARQFRKDKAGATPAHVAPLFSRLEIQEQTWVQLVGGFGRLFYLMAGKPDKIDARLSSDAGRRFHARRAARELLAHT